MEVSRPVRFLGLCAAFALLWAASPGILTDGGLWPLAVLAVAFWARYASAEGAWKGGIEFLCAALGWCLVMSWAAKVATQTLLFIGPGHGLYFAAQGWALRALRRKVPLALAAPLSWLLFETLRASLEPPFGVSWMRLGTHLHDTLWISGSARVWGTTGLTFVLAALGGALADLWGRAVDGESKGTRAWPIALGLLPLCAALVMSQLVPAPETSDGPRALLVQPGFEQKRKQQGNQSRAMMEEQLELTREGLAAARAAGGAEPDLVAWAETMLRIPIVSQDLVAALESGTRLDPWRGEGLDAAWARRAQANERDWIDGLLFGAGGRPALLPQGTVFVSGAEYLRPLDGRVRFQNAALVWAGPGKERIGPAAKRHLVPGAETMLGLEHVGMVREVILELAGYIPDFLGPVGDDPVLAFTARDGRSYRMGVAVCFDNAFDDVFTDAVRRADVDFHLVVSNEAWFERTQESEQMLAFSRLAALSTGRSVVRATQSGTSIVIGPDGRDVARLVDAQGEDEMVRGYLAATVPVPRAARSPFEASGTSSDRSHATPYVRLERLWFALATVVPTLLLLFALRGGGGGGTKPAKGAKPSAGKRLPPEPEG